MTAGSIESLADTILYVARAYELSKGFERVYVQRSTLDKEEYDGIIAGFRYGANFDKNSFISVSGFFPDDIDMTITWKCDDDATPSRRKAWPGWNLPSAFPARWAGLCI